MERIAVQDYQVLVLAAGDTVAAVSNAKGHLFEHFIAQLLHEFGFDAPAERNVNVTSDGIELDVVVHSSFTNQHAIAEGKAYSTNVKAQALTSFYGKLNMARFDEPATHGYLFALPRLVADGHEKACTAESRDPNFHYLDAQRVVERLIERKLIRPVNAVVPADKVTSDPALIIAEEGLYVCVKVLNSATRMAEHVLVWGREQDMPVPAVVMELLGESSYVADSSVRDLLSSGTSRRQHVSSHDSSSLVVVNVRGSSSDFEYQFPASPAFFVGRRGIVAEFSKIIERGRGTFVLNAQSGWGKSSLALKLKTMIEQSGGYGLVVDSRTASSPLFVVEALRTAASQAEKAGLLSFAEDGSWASLKSAVATIGSARWVKPAPLMVFFDQFENVFQDEVTTRQFRDLTFLVNELQCSLLVGFAWKTDLVGWTESHPYRLRDEIRAESTQITVDPMGAKDIEALLRRLEKRLGQKLGRDFRQRIREYSQGLPWLFKKLAGHAIREIEENGKTQEQLVSEALNVQSLFDSDLAGLQPIEKDAVRHVARYAPVSAAEVTDKYDGAVIQSLLDRRLLVAVGEKLDTYWDTFRDFLNTGEVPIEDSYTIGLGPQSMTPVLVYVLGNRGEASVSVIAEAIGATPGSVVNTARTLRLLGIASSEASKVRIVDEITQANDREEALRRITLRALRRNKAYSLFVRLAERQGDSVTIATFSRELPQAFPAVDAKPSTWVTYARAFAFWFAYSGLAVVEGNSLTLPPDGYSGKSGIVSGAKAARIRSIGPDGPQRLHVAPGPCLNLLAKISEEALKFSDLSGAEARPLGALLLLSLAHIESSGNLVVNEGVLNDSGEVVGGVILAGLKGIKGGPEAISLLEADPAAEIIAVGKVFRDVIGAEWKDTTTHLVGKHFRSWARVAGVRISRARPAKMPV